MSGAYKILFIACIASPFVLYIYNYKLIEWLAPGDPLPQSAMYLVGVLNGFCFLVLLPVGIVGLWKLRRSVSS